MMTKVQKVRKPSVSGSWFSSSIKNGTLMSNPKLFNQVDDPIAPMAQSRIRVRTHL